MHQRTWRLWHRRIGWTAAIFLLYAGTTGIIVAATEFFGADEAEREALREMTSPVTTGAEEAAWTEPIRRAFAAAAQAAPDAPVDRLEVRWKATRPAVAIYTGVRGGGEDRSFVFDAATGELVEEADYVDKPFLYRLHSGEALGDGGLVGAMLWGLSLVLLTLSGLAIYLKMRRPGAKGWKRVYW